MEVEGLWDGKEKRDLNFLLPLQVQFTFFELRRLETQTPPRQLKLNSHGRSFCCKCHL
jgi:hypothetical protein